MRGDTVPYLAVGDAASQHRSKIVSGGRKEARIELPLGREPSPCAPPQNGWLTDAITPISPCRRGSATVWQLRRDSLRRSVRADRSRRSVRRSPRGDHVGQLPAVGVADIHVLDVANDVSGTAELPGHGNDLVFVTAPLDHHVHLDRARPASAAASMARSTPSTGKLTSLIRLKTASSRASRLTVMRPSPASRRERARAGVSSEPWW